MLIENALKSGLIFSLLFGGIITIIQIINPRYELKSYPKEIREDLPPMTNEEKRNFKLLALPMSLVLLVYFIWTTVAVYSKLEESFLNILIHSIIVIMTWNIFDLLIMDWLIYCTITPKYLVIPGSEGHKAYKNYKHHINGSLGIGLVFAVVGALAGTSVVYGILKVFVW